MSILMLPMLLLLPLLLMVPIVSISAPKPLSQKISKKLKAMNWKIINLSLEVTKLALDVSKRGL